MLLNFVSGPKPTNAQWMEAPSGVPDCPPGLEYLTKVDQLLVHQQVELLEGMIHLYFARILCS